MSDLNLHELANRLGFGSAQAELRKAGKWDEYAAETSDPREYRVAITYTSRHVETEVVTVIARNEQEAEDLAEEKFAHIFPFEAEIEHMEIRP